jgi:uncharacterized protein YegL
MTQQKLFKEKGVTYACFVRDHSGSMAELATKDKLKKELAMSNFNEQLAKLKADADDSMEVRVTVIEFDNECQCNIENEDVNEIKPLNSYWTGGMTALYDAIALGIHKVKQSIDKDEREDKAAIVIIQTDGLENASSDYHGNKGRAKLKDEITELENSGKWTFVFLGENIDKDVAMDIGVSSQNVISFQTKDSQHVYSVTADGLGDFMKLRKAGKTQTKAFYEDALKKEK